MICLLPGSSVNQTAYHNMADDELLFEAGMAAYTVIVASARTDGQTKTMAIRCALRASRGKKPTITIQYAPTSKFSC